MFLVDVLPLQDAQEGLLSLLPRQMHFVADAALSKLMGEEGSKAYLCLLNVGLGFLKVQLSSVYYIIGGIALT